MQDKYVDFKFILDERIPREIGLEFVAIRQLAIAVFGALEPEKRKKNCRKSLGNPIPTDARYRQKLENYRVKLTAITIEAS